MSGEVLEEQVDLDPLANPRANPEGQPNQQVGAAVAEIAPDECVGFDGSPSKLKTPRIE
jgi:hypothetical protein